MYLAALNRAGVSSFLASLVLAPAGSARAESRAEILIVQQPQPQISVAGATATFTVVARAQPERPITYQWQKRGLESPFDDIAQATAATFTTGPLTLADGKTDYRCAISIPGQTVLSQPATLYVTPDRSPPTVAGIASVNPFTVDICFNEPVNSKSALPLSNYQLEDNRVVAVTVLPDDRRVQLSLNRPAVNPRLSIRNVTDLAGNRIVDAQSYRSITWADSADIGEVRLPGSNFSCRIGEVSVQAGGSEPKPTADSFHFVYTPGIDDFDLVVQIPRFAASQPIPNGVEPVLLIPQVTLADLGFYTVEIAASSDGRAIRSQPAHLEIGPAGAPLSRDKLEDLYPPARRLPSAGGSGGGGTPPGVPVSAGTIETRILNNANSTTSPGEPSHCGVLGGASRWFGPLYTAEPDMIFEIDTVGSDIDTILAIYTGPNLLFLTNIACAAGPEAASTVRFAATPNALYNVTVDGLGGATGNIVLNYKLGQPPLFTVSPANQTLAPGSSISLSGAADGTPAPSFQWRRNGSNLPGETSPSLTLTAVTPADAAVYSLVASNFMGSVATNALVQVGHPFTLTALPNPTNAALLILGPTNELASNAYVLNATIDFNTWQSIWTNTTLLTTTNFFDPDSLFLPRRFYRVTPEPAPPQRKTPPGNGRGLKLQAAIN